MRTALPFAFALLVAALLAACGGSSSGDGRSAIEPRFETDAATLDAALQCTPFVHPDKPPVLLVHGTATAGYEQYDWTYIPLLAERGFDVCAITYPDRGLGDQQISAEYVANAIRRIHERTDRKVAMIGHSQGAGMPRWALKWWPSARDLVEDFVLLAGPNHGTDAAALADLFGGLGLPGQMPEAFWQFASGSQFIAAVNRDDETPGDVDYTSIYTLFDELVQPVIPVPTAALDLGLNNPKVANILLQDVCPGRLVDHFTIGLTDRLTFDLVIDAITNSGPADLARAGGAGLCGLAPIVPDQIVASNDAQTLIGILEQSAAIGLPDFHLFAAEPPLKEYARP